MNRFRRLFLNKNQRVLNIYCTAGFPKLDDTLSVMKALQQAGTDIIEIGMPYSDPIADGEAIQKSDDIALKNGMTIKHLFQQLWNMRIEISVPVVLMGYLNPVLQYGFEKFCAKCAEVGIDGMIIPDLPAYEFENTYGKIVKQYGLDFIFLVTPETSEKRVRMLDTLSSGFLYAVTSSSTTGGEKDFEAVNKYLHILKSYGLKNPILAGFGVKDKESFDKVCEVADGAIIGSAFVKTLQQAYTQGKSLEAATVQFVESIIQ